MREILSKGKSVILLAKVLINRYYYQCVIVLANGVIAQLGERLVCNQEVRGSIPLGSTKLMAA